MASQRRDSEIGRTTYASDFLRTSDSSVRVEIKDTDQLDLSEYESYADGLQTYKTMAKSLHDQDKFVEAVPMYHKVLKIQLQVYGADHTDTANTYKDMARALAKQGRVQEALKMFKNAFGIYCRVLGPDHPTTEMAQELMEWVRHDAEISSQRTRGEAKATRRNTIGPSTWSSSNDMAATRRSSTGMARRPSWNGMARRPSEGGMARRPSAGGMARRPSANGMTRRPSANGMARRPSLNGRARRRSSSASRRSSTGTFTRRRSTNDAECIIS